MGDKNVVLLTVGLGIDLVARDACFRLEFVFEDAGRAISRWAVRGRSWSVLFDLGVLARIGVEFLFVAAVNLCRSSLFGRWC